MWKFATIFTNIIHKIIRKKCSRKESVHFLIGKQRDTSFITNQKYKIFCKEFRGY